MKLKWFGVLLVGLLVLGFLAGCGASEQPATDGTTAASVVASADEFEAAAAADGTWIVAALDDITIDGDVVLDGDFENRDVVDRKIALYAQDADRNVTDRYTLTVDRLVIRSENARIQGGTVVGDILVEADGFRLIGATVEGNVIFADAAYEGSFSMEDATVSGDISVQ